VEVRASRVRSVNRVKPEALGRMVFQGLPGSREFPVPRVLRDPWVALAPLETRDQTGIRANLGRVDSREAVASLASLALMAPLDRPALQGQRAPLGRQDLKALRVPLVPAHWPVLRGCQGFPGNKVPQAPPVSQVMRASSGLRASVGQWGPSGQ
jgi:hypothetical protein